MELCVCSHSPLSRAESKNEWSCASVLTHLYLEPRVRMGGAVRLFSLNASMAWTGTICTETVNVNVVDAL